MSLLKDEVNKLTKISDYRFKVDSVKKIIGEFKNVFLKEENFNKAVSIDNKVSPVYVELKKMIEIIDNQIKNDQFCLKFKTDNIIDGYGNVAVRI